VALCSEVTKRLGVHRIDLIVNPMTACAVDILVLERPQRL
jgi:hypothetical protein